MINFTPFPNIETERLILRRMNYNDINDLFEMRKDPRMIEHVDGKVEQNLDETKIYINKMNRGVDDNRWIIWAIEYKQFNKVIGTISIWKINEEKNSGELGYGIIPDYQGQGLMKESLLSVIEYGFNTVKLKELNAYTEEKNLRSIKLLESCNFREVNKVEEKGYFNNRTYNMVIYRLDA